MVIFFLPQKVIYPENFFRILLIFLLTQLIACSVSSPLRYWENTISFSAYAEQVFRRQNQITSEILMLPEDEVEKNDFQDLLNAEQKLQDACRLLNEYAVRERDHIRMGLLFKKKVKGSVKKCEEMILETDTLLQRKTDNIPGGKYEKPRTTAY